MSKLPSEPGYIAGLSTTGGANAAEARVRQLRQLKFTLHERSQAMNLPVNKETFKSILESELTEASRRKDNPLIAQVPMEVNAAVERLKHFQAGTTTAPVPYALPVPDVKQHSVPNTLQAGEQSLSGHIARISNLYGLDPLLVNAVIKQESGYRPKVVSSAGAIGLMQLMPATAKDLGVSDPYDPVQNLEGGVKYLSQQLKRFGGNVALALAAYNAGPNAVAKYNGVPPYKETQNYVRTILKNYLQTKYKN